MVLEENNDEEMMMKIRHRKLEQQGDNRLHHNTTASDNSKNDPFLPLAENEYNSNVGNNDDDDDDDDDHGNKNSSLEMEQQSLVTAVVIPNSTSAPEQHNNVTLYRRWSCGYAAILLLLQTLFPCSQWLFIYPVTKSLWIDLISGISVGIMVIPQGMSYAVLAGLPVEYGLYGAVLPSFAYAMFGSSRQLSIGPVAMISLLFHSGLSAHYHQVKNTPDETDSSSQQLLQRYETLAVQASAIAGFIYLFMAICQLGFLTNYLSHSVISGFTTGAAILIALSQFQHIVGYRVVGSSFLPILWNIVRNMNHLNPFTMFYGTAFTIFLLLTRYWKTTNRILQALHIAGPLLITIVALLIPNKNNDDDHDNRDDADTNNSSSSGHLRLPVVGPIPRGLPSSTIQYWWPLDNTLIEFIPTILTIVLVGFMESIAIAKQLAKQHNYRIDSNGELYGLGMANLLGGAFHAYPVAGSFSRSAINCNAHSPLSGVFSATTVGISLLYLTQVFQHLPLCALAAIVLAGVVSVMDVKEALRLYCDDKRDFGVWMTACLGVLFLGVEAGLAVSIVVSFAVLVPWQPSVHRMRRLPDTTVYVDTENRNSDIEEEEEDVVILRISSSLNFVNSNWVLSKIRHSSCCDVTRCIILEMTSVSSIDTAAVNDVQRWIDECNSRHISIYVVGCSPQFNDRMFRILTREPQSTLVQTTIENAVLCYNRQSAGHQSLIHAQDTA